MCSRRREDRATRPTAPDVTGASTADAEPAVTDTGMRASTSDAERDPPRWCAGVHGAGSAAPMVSAVAMSEAAERGAGSRRRPMDCPGFATGVVPGSRITASAMPKRAVATIVSSQ